MSKKSLNTLLQQAWRAARLFATSFVAQLYLLPGGKLNEHLLVSAAVAGAEAVYRQVSPVGSARIISSLAKWLTALAGAAQSAEPVAPTGSKSVITVVTKDAVSAAKALQAGLAQGGLVKPGLTVVGEGSSSTPAPAPSQVPDGSGGFVEPGSSVEAASVAPAPAEAVSEAPTGSDGRPLSVIS